MKGLIINDLLSMRKLLKSILFVFVIFAVIWGITGQPETVAVMFGVMSLTYMLNLFSYDEFYHWDKYTSILPLSRKQVVLARYATFGIIALTTQVFALVYCALIKGFNTDLFFVFLAILLIDVYGASVLIPITYKMGVQKSRMLYVVLLFVPFGILLGILALLKEMGLTLSAGMAGFILLGCLLVLALCLIISIKVSVRIASRKEY